MKIESIGSAGVAVAAVAAFVMCLMNLLFHPVEVPQISNGLCLPSPDLWNFDRFWSWIINVVLIGIIAILLWLINRSFNFIRTTEPAWPILFLIMSSSCPLFTLGLNTSVLLCLCNIVCLALIFTTYDSQNATQQMFVLGVIAGIGSMFQYAFIPMAFVYFLWALFMKVLRLKETLSLIAGLLCPYWITLGLGWLHLSDFHYPSFSPMSWLSEDRTDLFLLLTGIALAAAFGFLLALINSIKLYAGNSKVNAMNLCLNVMGLAAVICILADYENMAAYVVTLYVVAAAQLANICALWNPRKPWLVSFIPSLVYIFLFVGTLI